MTMNVQNIRVRSHGLIESFRSVAVAPEIGGNRTDDADGIEIGQAGHIFDENHE